jgi:hypothetical protein
MQQCRKRNTSWVNEGADESSHNEAVTCLAESMDHSGVGVSLLLNTTRTS